MRLTYNLALLCLWAAAWLFAPSRCLAAVEGRINRPAVVRVTIDPLLTDTTLQESSYQEYLLRLFRRQSGDLATALATGLGRTVFTGLVMPDLSETAPAEQSEERDSFLVSVHATAHYGLTDDNGLATFLAGASCFTLSGLDMFRYRSQSRSRVAVFYIGEKGQRIKLLERQYESRREAKGDFFSAMNVAQEATWIEDLTSEVLTDIKAQILADLPGHIIERAWTLTGENLREPQKLPTPIQELARPLVSIAEPPRGGPLNLQDLIRTASLSTFQLITPTGTGSGFVLSNRGYLLTSYHNIAGAGELRVRFRDGREFPVRVFFNDEERDLSILVAPPQDLTALPLGDSVDLEIGSTVISLGFPAEKGLAFARGRVSSLANYRGMPMLLTDSRTEAGSSGGPLLNEQGEVVGINFSKTQGHGRDTTISLPINEARKSFAHLLDPR